MAKNLNITNMKKEVKKLDSQTEHTIVIDESEYKLKIDVIFRKTKQNKLLNDLVEFFNEMNQKIELTDIASPYITLLLIKHFTSLEVSDNIDEALELLDILIDLDLLVQVVNLMPESEVIKIYELIQSTVSNMRENIELTAEEAERMANVVENEELKDALKGGNG